MEERFSTGTVLKIEFYCVINTRLDTSVTFSLWTKELVESCSCSVRNIFSFLKSRLKSVKSRRFFGHEGFDSTSGSMCLVLCACSAEGPREPDESWERGETEIYLHDWELITSIQHIQYRHELISLTVRHSGAGKQDGASWANMLLLNLLCMDSGTMKRWVPIWRHLEHPAVVAPLILPGLSRHLCFPNTPCNIVKQANVICSSAEPLLAWLLVPST